MSTRHRGAAIVFWLSVYFLYVTFLRDPRGIVVLLIHLALLPVVFPLWIFASQEWQDASLEVLWARLHICEEIAPSVLSEVGHSLHTTSDTRQHLGHSGSEAGAGRVR